MYSIRREKLNLFIIGGSIVLETERRIYNFLYKVGIYKCATLLSIGIIVYQRISVCAHTNTVSREHIFYAK